MKLKTEILKNYELYLLYWMVKHDIRYGIKHIWFSDKFSHNVNGEMSCYDVLENVKIDYLNDCLDNDVTPYLRFTKNNMNILMGRIGVNYILSEK